MADSERMVCVPKGKYEVMKALCDQATYWYVVTQAATHLQAEGVSDYNVTQGLLRTIEAYRDDDSKVVPKEAEFGYTIEDIEGDIEWHTYGGSDPDFEESTWK